MSRARASSSWLVVVAACSGHAAVTPRTPAPGPDPIAVALRGAIEDGDAARARDALCAAYARAGIACADEIPIVALAPTDVMSSLGMYDEVRLTPIPPVGGGLSHWDHWSALLAGGAWPARAAFRDDAEARRVAAMLIVSVLAHELGHHVARRFSCDRGAGERELVADELSVPIVAELAAHDPELGALHARMRAIADAMIDAVPAAARVEVPRDADAAAWVAAHPTLPTAIPSYVALHLSRQRAVLAAPTAGGRTRARCIDGHARALATRIVRPGQVVTLGRVPLEVTDLYALAPDGSAWLARLAPAGWAISPIVVGPTGATVGPPVAVIGALRDAFGVGFAAASPTRFALDDGEDVHAIALAADGPAVSTLAHSPQERLAFDRAGTLYAGHADDAAWTARVLGPGPAVALPRLALDHGEGTWADGPLAGARAVPSAFAIDGARVVFYDPWRAALREAGPDGVVTLAGELRGHRDGATTVATLADVVAVARAADGAVIWLEVTGSQTPTELRLRAYHPAR